MARSGGNWVAIRELRHHADGIEAQIQRGVQLIDETGTLPLQGLMLQLSAPNHDGTSASAQIVALGRFALGEQRSGLRLRMTLFGSGSDERSQQLTVSRGGEAQRLVLAPGHEEGEVFPSALTTVVDHARQGMAHVLAGPDHLLFLAATQLPAIQANAVRFASVAAVALGPVWLVHRLAALA